MDKIEDTNKIIAKFMEESLSPNEGVIYLDVDHPQFNYHGDTCGLYKHNSRMYHNSWDWLMPVVEKIESETDTTFNIENDNCHVEGGFSLSVYEHSKLESVYKAVIKFIKWYNE